VCLRMLRVQALSGVTVEDSKERLKRNVLGDSHKAETSKLFSGGS
jgi:hypothetical protein